MLQNNVDVDDTRQYLYEMKNDVLNISELAFYEKNPRKYSDKLIQKLVNSIHAFGFIGPILIDNKKRIISGHARVMAAQKLDIKQIPVVYVNHLTPEKIRAFRIADNKIASNPEWDMQILAEELLLISENSQFDLYATGYEIPEVDLILCDNFEDKDSQEDDPVDEVLYDVPKRVKTGDVWQLGDHMLVCGNALEKKSYNAILEATNAHVVFTDPPYNVPINGHVCGNGKNTHREFVMASGEMSSNDFVNFLKSVCELMHQYTCDGSLHYICMDWRHIHELLSAGKDVYNEVKNICIWNKDNAGMGSLYRSKHEMIVVFKNGVASHTNNIELGKHGRYRTNIWNYPGANSTRNKNRKNDLADHPTVKPCAMVMDVLLDCTKRNQFVLDPFAGSGTTLIAAEKTGRVARCIEIDPHYCDVILKRWESLTGKIAIYSKNVEVEVYDDEF